MAERPKLVKVSDDIRRLSATIGDELATWPNVTSKPMFGMTAFYRGARIFAALPKTRAAGTERALLVKLPDVKHRRLTKSIGPGAGWVSFELESDADVPAALEWLGKAYERARKA